MLVYVDESVLGCITAGIVVVVGMAWAAWGVGFVRRVELRLLAEPAVSRLGLVWAPEGFTATVRAEGEADGRGVALELRARWLRPPRVTVRRGAERRDCADLDAAAAWLAER